MVVRLERADMPPRKRSEPSHDKMENQRTAIKYSFKRASLYPCEFGRQKGHPREGIFLTSVIQYPADRRLLGVDAPSTVNLPVLGVHFV